MWSADAAPYLLRTLLRLQHTVLQQAHLLPELPWVVGQQVLQALECIPPHALTVVPHLPQQILQSRISELEV